MSLEHLAKSVLVTTPQHYVNQLVARFLTVDLVIAASLRRSNTNFGRSGLLTEGQLCDDLSGCLCLVLDRLLPDFPLPYFGMFLNLACLSTAPMTDLVPCYT